MKMRQPLKSTIWQSVILMLLLTSALGAWGTSSVPKNIRVEQGTLGPSKIMIAVPKKWNKHVLIYAHGLRMESATLSAEFSLEDDLCRALLKEGWMIAATSYRRNGYLHDEAIEDIDQLRQHIISTYGAPDRIYLDGGSMGGAIVTKMAETHKGQYDGILAVGAVLSIGPLTYSFAPQMPLLFISNQNEMVDPRAYLGKLADVPQKPAIWQVKRDGHCNLNSKEELTALRALFAYCETGKIEYEKDVTIVMTPKSHARFRDGGMYANVTAAKSVNGNFDTQFTAADLQKLGIIHGELFNVSFKNKTVKVLYGSSFFDVPHGEWISFITADGYLKFARNFESAVAVLGCKEKDQIFIEAIATKAATK